MWKWAARVLNLYAEQYRKVFAVCIRRLTVPTVLVLAAALSAEPASKRGPRSKRVTPVVEAYRKAGPAVVNISTVTPMQMGGRPSGGEDDPFEEFMPRFFRRTVQVTSLGSGFLIHPDGYLVTNAHVVRRAQKITVTLADKSSFQADMVSANSKHDLAVLKIRDAGKRRFACLPLGRSDDLMIGETVLAIGNPMGYENTCTTGVISAQSRKLEFRGGLAYDKLIQVDAPINPGNSGGPLLNLNGELIGINTAIRPDAQGIGFAIPVDLLMEDMPHLLDFERLQRLVFGATVAQRHVGDGDELYVAAVEVGSPADEAGCKVGDKVKAMDGKALTQLPEYQIAMLRAIPTQIVRLACLRKGKPVDVRVKIGARPKPDGAALALKLFGLKFKVITAKYARQVRLPVDWGLQVTSVADGSPADELGLRRDDIVFQLGRWYVTDLDRVGMALEDVKVGESLGIGVLRGRTRTWLPIQTREKKPKASAPTRIRL